MKKVLFILAVICCTLSFAQENGSLRGKILDGNGFNEPLLMANVSLKNTKTSTHTNFNGNFEFTNINPGEYILKIQSLGYNDLELPITINSSKTVYIQEILTVKTYSLPNTGSMTTLKNEETTESTVGLE